MTARSDELGQLAASAPSAVGYDARAAVLEIELQGGRVYQYRKVPAAAYRLLRQAPSMGEFVNKVIKPRFEAIRV